MVTLIPYSADRGQALLPWIADFFGYHQGLIDSAAEWGISEADLAEAADTLDRWTANSDREVYLIVADGTEVGFLNLGYRGDRVAWIEDVYLDRQMRGRGTATAALAAAEEIVKTQGYTALCMEVSTRNEKALHLYHHLGYDSMSLVTVRKEFGENQRDRSATILGLEYKI